MGAVGVKLGAASTAPSRGGCWSSTRRLGGNVYLPREWAFGYTQGERLVPLSATPFTSSRRRLPVTGTGHGTTRSGEVGAELDASEIMHNERVSRRCESGLAPRYRVENT